MRLLLAALLLAAPANAQTDITSTKAYASMRAAGTLLGSAERCGVNPVRTQEIGTIAVINMARDWPPAAEDVFTMALMEAMMSAPWPSNCRTVLHLFRDLEQRLK